MFFLGGCLGPQTLDSVFFRKSLQPAFRSPSFLSDDLNLASLHKALEENVRQLKKSKDMEIRFGLSLKIKREDYIRALEKLMDVLEKDAKNFFSFVRKNFYFYAINKDGWKEKRWRKKRGRRRRKEGEIFLTSYYVPVIEGSFKRTKTFSYPLYKTPSDLVQFNLEEYRRRKSTQKRGEETNKEDNFCSSVYSSPLWGRISYERKEEGKIPFFVPFFNRREIDVQKKLSQKKLEWAWVDPLEAFFLQIQGSGVIKFKNGKRLYLGYHSQNGHPYVAIGKFVDLPKEEINLMTLKRFLRNLDSNERQRILNLNPSYIFFRELKEKEALSAFGTEVVPGRTVATDPLFFPRGSLGYLEFKKPVFSKKNKVEAESFESVNRFVLNQDSGGAIRGPHRLDLFWGEGEEAGFYAGSIKDWGHFYVLVPKKGFF